jgi:hypothetical protein
MRLRNYRKINQMAWKNIKEKNFEQLDFISKKAVDKPMKPLFYYSKTRESKELNLSQNCKVKTEKELTRRQKIIYNQILDDQREKEERYIKKKRKKGSAVPKKW